MDMYTEPKLPDTLSELLTVAIEDAEKLDRNTYRPEWMIWHSPATSSVDNKRICYVCLAGAVIAETLCVSPGAYMHADEYSQEVHLKLRALDDMRTGDLYTAAKRLDIDSEQDKLQLESVYAHLAYDGKVIAQPKFKNWEQFDRHLQSLKNVRDALQAAGL